MDATTKRRHRNHTIYRATEDTYISGAFYSTQSFEGLFTGLQETTSEGHLWPPSPDRRTNRVADRGGPFLTRRNRVLFLHTPTVDVTIPTGSIRRGSRFYGQIGSSIWPQSPSLLTVGSETDLEALGTTAISRCSPLKSKSQLGTAVGELREGLPSLVGRSFWKRDISKLRAAGGEYLNIEFGWKPLIKDIIDSANALSRASTILTQLARDSGKPVRRRYAFPQERDFSLHVSATDYGWPTAAGNFYTNPGRRFGSTITDRDVWFSGSFLYHLPKGDDFLSRVDEWQKKAHYLLGARLDPELLWNLAPWTWLVDWFGNFGDVVSNASAAIFDGLVMQYGYVMERKTETIVHDTVGIKFIDGTICNPSLHYVRESKRRLQATPFGFGLDDAVLSEWQLSILAALGISRKG